jgi:asparagine synthase (glutamine-hydrolysing)
MPSVVGVISKKDEDVSSKLAEMLSTLRHRGPDYAGAVIGNEVVFLKGSRHIDFSETKGHMAIGYNGLEDDQTTYQPFTDCTGDFFTVLDGRIFNAEQLAEGLTPHDVDGSVDGEVLTHLVEEKKATDLLSPVSTAMRQLDGVYAFAVMKDRQVALARDPVGVKPLYWGENEELFAFASERKALWRVGVKEADVFPPGHVGIVSSGRRTISPALTLQKPPLVHLEMDAAASKLCEALRNAVKKQIRKVEKIGVPFSGGVDSSLIAKLADEAGVNVTLYTVGLEGAYDIETAEDSASALGLPLKTRILSTDDVEDRISKVVYAIEEDSQMKVGTGLPLYAVAEEAALNGHRLLLTGQGSDEVFGGYRRYLTVLRSGGYKGLDDELWKDLLNTHNVNLGRDDAAAAANGLELAAPYLDQDTVRFATSLPPNLKVENVTDPLRKTVLRKAAETSGLPEEITRLPKKAIQYGSGIDKAIRNIAKNHGYENTKTYLTNVFDKVFKEFELPALQQ